MSRKTVLAFSCAFVGGVAFCTTSAMAAHDSFNRASLGNKWVVTDGNLFINNDQMQGDSLSLGYMKKSADDTTVRATVNLSGSGLQYGAVASGNIAGGSNAFVKIQSDDGVSFNNGGFYTGDNVPGLFFALATPVPSPALLTASFCGTTATMTIKSSAGTQHYTFDYGTSFGNGGGLGTYGPISLDDYKSHPARSCAADRDAVMVKATKAKDLSLAK